MSTIKLIYVHHKIINVSIPISSEIPLALLDLLSDKENHTLKNTINQLGGKFGITEQEMLQQTISKRGVFRTRVAWSVSQLRAINALESVRWGTFRITSFGLSLLEKKTTKKNILKIIRNSQVTKIIKKNNNVKNNTNPNKQLSNSLNHATLVRNTPLLLIVGCNISCSVMPNLSPN